MQTNTMKKQTSALRSALTLVWDLNIRAIPTALVWAVSLMFIFQAPNLLIALACATLCSTISLLNVSIVKFSHIRVKPLALVKSPEFRKILLLNIVVGNLFVFAVNNMLNLKPSSIWISLSLTSIALTLFLLWIALMLIFNPIFVNALATQAAKPTAEIFMLYVKKHKKEVAITGVIVVACAPLVFFFICLVLTLTQAITIVTSEKMMEVEA